MRETSDALHALFAGDSLSKTIAAGSPSTTVVQLGVGDAAAWERGQVANFTGAGATLANHRRTARIKVVDTVLDRLTIVPALPAVPASGDLVRGGTVEWLYAATAIHYFRPTYSTPAQALLDAADEHGCVLYYGIRSSRPGSFSAEHDTYEVRFISRDLSWAEAGVQRAKWLLHRRRASLTIDGRTITALRTGSMSTRSRDDELEEFVAPVYVSHEEAA